MNIMYQDKYPQRGGRDQQHDGDSAKKAKRNIVPIAPEDNLGCLDSVTPQAAGDTALSAVSLTSDAKWHFDEPKPFEREVEEDFLRIGEPTKKMKVQSRSTAITPHSAGYVVEFLPDQA